MIEYDVLTVSRESGDSNVLAYRTGETTLFVPYDWLDPNDTVVFILKSNDSRKTLTAVSGEFYTPDGEEKIIADNDEEWIDFKPDNSGNSFWLYIALAIAVIIIVALVVVVIIVIRKKKK